MRQIQCAAPKQGPDPAQTCTQRRTDLQNNTDKILSLMRRARFFFFPSKEGKTGWQNKTRRAPEVFALSLAVETLSIPSLQKCDRMKRINVTTGTQNISLCGSEVSQQRTLEVQKLDGKAY